MDLLEAISVRHSVRKYEERPLAGEAVAALQNTIVELNGKFGLHIQLVTEEPKAFTGILSYGKFHGVRNYIVMAGQRTPQFARRVGYAGERLVLLAQTLGLNTCWVGISYRKVDGAFVLEKGERLACVIAVGYGATQGVDHRRKTTTEVSNVSADSPEWFRRGVEAALLAPTALNQQKFRFDLLPATDGGLPKVSVRSGRSIFGYTDIDLGIAMCHFELAAGEGRYEPWNL